MTLLQLPVYIKLKKTHGFKFFIVTTIYLEEHHLSIYDAFFCLMVRL